MKFEAPKFEESNNPNISHDVGNLREFRVLFGYLIATLLLLWLLVESLIWAMPQLISIELERQWLSGMGQVLLADKSSHRDPKMQALADALTRRMGLPPNSITVYISSQSDPNAYATFGGNIVLHQGLLDKLAYEESVATLLAHEMAHIKHRDPLRGMSRTLFYNLIAASFGSNTHLNILMSLEGMRYSRELERAADQEAVRAVAAYYGSVGGAVSLFNELKSIEQNTTEHDEGTYLPIDWLSTHPNTAERLSYVKKLAQKNGYPMTPAKLPNPWGKSSVSR